MSLTDTELALAIIEAGEVIVREAWITVLNSHGLPRLVAEGETAPVLVGVISG